MFKDISIKGKILLLSLITIMIVSIAIAVDSIYSIKKFSNKNIENFKNEAYAKKELELKNYVSLAVKTVEAYHNRTSIDKIKVEVQEQLKLQTKFLFSIFQFKNFLLALSFKFPITMITISMFFLNLVLIVFHGLFSI